MWNEEYPLWMLVLAGLIGQIPTTCIWWNNRSLRTDIRNTLESLKKEEDNS